MTLAIECALGMDAKVHAATIRQTIGGVVTITDCGAEALRAIRTEAELGVIGADRVCLVCFKELTDDE